jgi:hypothetical protein
LIAVVPEVTDVLRPEAIETARCQVVSDLQLKLGETAEPVPCLMWKGSLFLDTEQLAGCSRAERLRLLLNEIALPVGSPARPKKPCNTLAMRGLMHCALKWLKEPPWPSDSCAQWETDASPCLKHLVC